MKKYWAFIFYLAIITLFSCNGGNKGNTATATDETTGKESFETTVFEFNDTTKLVEESPQSPTLVINISLPVIKAKNSNVTENANRAIAYTLFENNEDPLPVACKKYADSLKELYNEQLPYYHNLGETDTPAAFFNNYCIINAEAKSGYKGIINYIIYLEEYSGGAHPNSYYTVLNFDPKSGEEILLESIFKPGYEEELTKAIKTALENDGNLSEHFNEEKIEEVYISNNFILEKEQITFVYNKYDISYYAAGDIFVNIGYDKLKHILK